ncbi:MAG: class I SAM-dependent DNA methyltransferase [Wujia sp.]
MESYESFAAVYDTLMDNIPYDEWFAYLHELLQEYNIKDGIIAELGCGTGNITERLSKCGYDMIGIDNAPAMLEIANRKKAENQTSTLYLCQDMREFELFGTVGAIISICDSVNYILDEEELTDVFRLVNNYLDTDGIFIFDFHTQHYYRDIVASSTIAEDRDDISFIWDNYYDEETDVNELALSLFLREQEDLFRKYEELHLQRGYTVEEMKQIVEASGLILLQCYDAFTHAPATEDSERVYIIAREHTTAGDKFAIAQNFQKNGE